jgi:hypothetical protein
MKLLLQARMPDSSETGETGGETRDRQGQGSHATRVALLALVARHAAISRRTFINNAG